MLSPAASGKRPAAPPARSREPSKRPRKPAARDADGSSDDDEPLGAADDEQAAYDPAAPDRALVDGDVAPGDRLGRADSVPSVASVAARVGVAQLTPLERQVVALKAAHGGYVLMFEVGYRYTFYGEDAALAAQLLDIWAYRKHHLTIASVPTHRLDVHLARLLQAGLRVGVVDQAETAARKKAGMGGEARSGTFERKVSALYTRGSYIPASDEASLGSANQIVVVVEAAAPTPAPAAGAGGGGTAQLSILALDTFSNTLTYDSFHDGPLRSELHARLTALAPAELLAPGRTLAPTGDAWRADGLVGAMALSRESARALLFYARAPPPVAGASGAYVASAGGALPTSAPSGSAADPAARLELLPADAFDLGAALELLVGAATTELSLIHI